MKPNLLYICLVPIYGSVLVTLVNGQGNQPPKGLLFNPLQGQGPVQNQPQLPPKAASQPQSNNVPKTGSQQLPNSNQGISQDVPKGGLQQISNQGNPQQLAQNVQQNIGQQQLLNAIPKAQGLPQNLPKQQATNETGNVVFQQSGTAQPPINPALAGAQTGNLTLGQSGVNLASPQNGSQDGSIPEIVYLQETNQHSPQSSQAESIIVQETQAILGQDSQFQQVPSLFASGVSNNSLPNNQTGPASNTSSFGNDSNTGSLQCINGGVLQCQCAPGYKGDRCEQIEDFCEKKIDEEFQGVGPTWRQKCAEGNKGHCVSDTEKGLAYCECQPDFSGTFCEAHRAVQAHRILHACVNLQFSHNDQLGDSNGILSKEEIAALNLPYPVEEMYSLCPTYQDEEFACMPNDLRCFLSLCEVAEGWCLPLLLVERSKRAVMEQEGF